MRLFTLLIVLTIFLHPVNTKAAPITNFGGQMVGIFYCACNVLPSWVLYIRDVRYQMPMPIMYIPGVTYLYKMYQPRPAVNALGTFAPTGVCLIPSPDGCFPPLVLPIIGTMLQLGTSAAIVPGK